jgi:signal transduction histidine kinase
MQDFTRRNLVLPAAIALVAASAMVLLWQTLRSNHVARVASVTDATSYATRSELARRLIVQLQSLEALADSWISAETERPDVKGALAAIRFEGVEVVAWSGDDGARFVATSANPESSHVPTEAQWAEVAPFIAEAERATKATAVGPYVDDAGHSTFRYYSPVRRGLRYGTLVAVIDAHDLLDALLVDEAVGYEIRVSCCDGVELYRRGAADDGLPSAWTRDGWIAPAPGLVWNVRHRPSPDLPAHLDTSAVDSVLIVGLALAMLLGGLVFETRRANDRAAAANAAEQRLRVLHRELEERVIARTQKLGEVLRDLNTINLAVSHDLRSPLNAISLVAGQLEASNRDEVARPRLEKIAANVTRMTAMLNRLLGYARTAAFGAELEDVDMRALAEQVVREQSLDAHTVTIAAVPPALADRVIVHILLSNLVANAVQHAGAGRSLRIDIGSRGMDGDVPAYFVRDNGLGLDASLAAQLFKPLRDRQGAQGSGGLGLGLAIAARAVHRHGGRIWVESEPGRGTTFLFTLQPEPNAADAHERDDD